MATGGSTEEKSVLRLRCSCYGHEQDVRAVAPLPYPEGSFVSGSRDLTARVWAPNEEDVGFTEKLAAAGHTKFISAVCVLPPDEAYPHGVILTGSNDSDILAYTISSPSPIYRLTGHSNTVCSLASGKFSQVISGSWDKTAKVWMKEKCVMTLEGHEQAVWCVLIMPEKGYMLTGSADKSIKLWRAGKCERTFNGHADCVRGLAVISSDSFLSCGNDATIRQWLLSGECAGIFYGHTNYIYSIAVFPNAKDFVSCGEDRTLRLWRGGECVQTIALPAQSIWSVAILKNGDVVTGASDGVIRVFTFDVARMADPAEQQAFLDNLSSSVIPAQIGDINTDELVGPEALEQPGRKDGQTLMIRRGDAIEAHQWDGTSGIWIKIGDVVGGSGGSQASSGKVLYEGKEYDYVFDVELQEGRPPLKLPYNTGEDPWHAARAFLERNELSQMFLDQVANFIQQNTRGVTLGAAAPTGFADPFTGGSRYVPGSMGGASGGGFTSAHPQGDPLTGGSRYVPGGTANHQSTGGAVASAADNSYFPETSYIKFEQVNIQGIFMKVREFNSQVNDDRKLDAEEISSLENLMGGKTDATQQQMSLVWKILNWPPGSLFPALDILRHLLCKASINAQLCSSETGARLVEYAINLLSKDNVPNNQRLMLRALCNAFSHSTGELLMSQNDESLVRTVLQMTHPTDRHTQVALSSFFLNLIIAFRRHGNPEGVTRVLFAVAELSQTQTEVEAHFRILVAIGTAISGDAERTELAASLDLSNFIRVCQVCEESDKVRGCAAQLKHLIR